MLCLEIFIRYEIIAGFHFLKSMMKQRPDAVLCLSHKKLKQVSH